MTHNTGIMSVTVEWTASVHPDETAVPAATTSHYWTVALAKPEKEGVYKGMAVGNFCSSSVSMHRF